MSKAERTIPHGRQTATAMFAKWLGELLTSRNQPHARVPRYRMVPEMTPVGRHSIAGQNPGDAAVALFQGHVNRKGERKLYATNLQRKVMIPHGKDYRGKIGFKTQQKINAGVL